MRCPPRTTATRRLTLALFLSLFAFFLVALSSSIGPASANKASPALRAAMSPSQIGQWSAPELLQTTPVHISVLPDGRLLYWGRDKVPDQRPATSLDRWDVAGGSNAYTWHPVTKASVRVRNETTNLFCSSHSFLPDGRLLVAGGHNRYDLTPDVEGIGETDVNTFDYRTNSWALGPSMGKGRWYPSSVVTARGEVAIIAGTYWDGVKKPIVNGREVPATERNPDPEVYSPAGQGSLRQLGRSHFYDMYPFLHLAPNGKVFIPGPELGSFNKSSRYYDPNAADGTDPFSTVARFDPAAAEEESHLNGTSVMYDAVRGKVLMVGGKTSLQGLTIGTARVIDLSDAAPAWRRVQPMRVARKFHTATLLPDGKVLVTGGTPCSGANDIACSDQAAVQQARSPEMWDPSREGDPWVLLAENPVTIPRVYHSVALLLPDARVLVGGGGLPAAGGETAGGRTCIDGQAHKDPDCRIFGHNDVQFFSPPYLFDANGQPAVRPVINSAPASAGFGQSVFVGASNPADIGSVVLVRLPSVTHGVSFDQRRVVLGFAPVAGGLNVTMPSDARICPPGHYMLFVSNHSGVPSVARIIQVTAAPSTLVPAEVGGRIARNFDGRLVVFYRGAGGDLVHTAQNTPGGDWLPHVSLGGFITSNPVAIAHADGRLHVFVLGSDGFLFHQWQTTPGGAWSNWHWLGAGIRSSSELAVARNTNGRLQLFFRGMDNSLQYVTQTAADPNSWGAPVSLGGIITDEPTVAANADGRLQVFVRGADSGIFHLWQTTPGGGWSNWRSLGHSIYGALSAGRSANGRLYIFFRGWDNALWYASQSQPGSEAWTAHTSLGGGIWAAPAVGVNADGRLEVFVHGSDNGLHHQRETAPGSGQWSGWMGLGGILSAPPSVAINQNGRLQVVVRGSNNSLFHNLQTAPNGQSWTGFGVVGGSASSF